MQVKPFSPNASSPAVLLGMAIATFLFASTLAAAEPKLIAHWPLATDARDIVGNLHGEAVAVSFDTAGRPSTGFDGRDSLIRIPDLSELHLGTSDFSLSLWIKCQTPMTNALGDLISK